MTEYGDDGELCLFCEKPIIEGFVRVTPKGLEKIRESSRRRGDGLFPHLMEVSNLTVHLKCRKSYINDDMIKAFQRRMISMITTATEVKEEPPEEKPPPPIEFDIQSQCLICGNEILHRSKLRQIKLPRTKESLKSISLSRNDLVGETVLRRIQDVDLVAVGAKYHVYCYDNFRLSALSHAVQFGEYRKRGRPEADFTIAAMEEIYRHIKQYGDERQFSLTDLKNCVTDKCPDERLIVKKLEEKYGDKLMISKLDGKTTLICLRDSIPKVLHEAWKTANAHQSAKLGSHVGFTCNSCYFPILGFRYSCVECVNVKYNHCARCEANREHDHHYMLRVPGPRPEVEFTAVMTNIRLALKSRAVLSDREVEIKYEPASDDEDIKPIIDPLNVLLEHTKPKGSGLGQDVPNVSTEDPPDSPVSSVGKDQPIPELAVPSTSHTRVARSKQSFLVRNPLVKKTVRTKTRSQSNRKVKAAIKKIRSMSSEELGVTVPVPFKMPKQEPIEYEPGSDDEDIKPIDPLKMPLEHTKPYGSGLGQDVLNVSTRPTEGPQDPPVSSIGSRDQLIPAFGVPSTSDTMIAQSRQLSQKRNALGRKTVRTKPRSQSKRKVKSATKKRKSKPDQGLGVTVPVPFEMPKQEPIHYELGSDVEDIKPIDPLNLQLEHTMPNGSVLSQDVPNVPTRPADDPQDPSVPSICRDQQILALAVPTTSDTMVAHSQSTLKRNPLSRKTVRTKPRSQSKRKVKLATKKRKSTSDQGLGVTVPVPFKMPKQEPLHADSGDTADRPCTAGLGSQSKEDDFRDFTMENNRDDDEEEYYRGLSLLLS